MPWQIVQFPKFPLSTPYEMYGEECLILMLESLRELPRNLLEQL